MTEIDDRYEHLKEWSTNHALEPGAFTEQWMALLCILSDEEVMRFRKRCSMPPMLDTSLGYTLGEALSAELTRRNLSIQLKTRHEQRPH